MDYDPSSLELRETAIFSAWLESLRDRRARDRIKERLRRLSLGLVGDTRPIGCGVVELRIDCGPGYWIYYIKVRRNLMVILMGGDKSSQSRDIPLAIKLAEYIEVSD